MGKLIAVVGNSGVGKTTLVNRLCEKGSFLPFLEVTDEKPFLQKFKKNLKDYCLANQIDFLLYNAETQLSILGKDLIGVVDGGLDFIFHVFTKRFHQKGYLDEDEFHLCERLYSVLRLLLPPADLLIILKAPLEIITERMRKRGREIDIERTQDLTEIEKLIDEWLAHFSMSPMIYVDASRDDPSYSAIIDDLVRDVKAKLGF